MNLWIICMLAWFVIMAAFLCWNCSAHRARPNRRGQPFLVRRPRQRRKAS